MKVLRFVLLPLLLASHLHADDHYAPIPVYSTIKDIRHPTLDDYRRIQDYLTNGERSIIKRLKDYEPNARNFKIIGDRADQLPEFGSIAINSSDAERGNCVIVYSSFNKNYPRGLKRLVKLLAASDFKGHVLWRLGGWPNAEGGSLRLAHVPYAFKVSFFKEAQRLGYKRAFWLDTSIVPHVSVNTIFDMIKAKGYFIMGNSHVIGPYMHGTAADAFGLTLEQTHEIPSCSAGITGIDFTNPRGLQILDAWHQAAQNAVAFFSPRSDQNALSMVLHKLGISDFIPISRLAHNKNEIGPNTLLRIEREFVNELSLE